MLKTAGTGPGSPRCVLASLLALQCSTWDPAAATGTEDDWLGSSAPMWWSHADAATYAAWLTDAGLVIEHQEFVPEGTGGHALFWARQPG
jgi:hypothetical protein